MRKRIMSLFCFLVLSLCLMPTTAFADYVSPNELWVGGTNVVSGGYWITNDDGGLEASDSSNYNVYYDGNGNLWLHNAKIAGQGSGHAATGIYAYYDKWEDTDIALTIHLEGENSVSNGFPVYVTPWGGNASLTISGPGSLTATSTVGGNGGIFVKGDFSSLTIENGADVTVNSARSSAVTIVADAQGAGTLTVDNATLRAYGHYIDDTSISYSICFSYTGNSNNIVDGSRVLRLSGNSLIYTDYMQATYSNLVIDAPETAGGIIFDGAEGTVYGDVTLDRGLIVNEGETLTIPERSTLNSNGNLTNNGTIINKGTLTGPIAGNGTSTPAVTTQPKNLAVTEGEAATFAIEATGGNLSYQWQQSTDNGRSWTDIDGATGASYATEASTANMNGYQYRCVVSNSAGSATSDAATLTVHVHAWGEPAWSWSEDGKTCTVTFTCENDKTHKETPEVTVTSAVKTPATCTEAGVTAYTATVEFGGKTYSDAKDVTDIPATGHKYGEPTWSWSEDGKTAAATFTCQNDESHQATETATVTSETKSEPTCTESGVTTYTATVEFGGQTYTSTKDVADIPATGHKLTKTEAEAATCTKPGNTEYWTCGACDKIFSDGAGEHEIALDDTVVPATGHSWGEDGHCAACGAVDPDFTPAIIAGADATWQKGSGKDLAFTSNAAYGDFQKVQVDGRDVDAADYTVGEGSTVVTLKASYLETLSAGKHTLGIVSETGVAETEFTIAAKTQAPADEESLAATGDASMLAAGALLVIALASIAAGGLILKRSRS